VLAGDLNIQEKDTPGSEYSTALEGPLSRLVDVFAGLGYRTRYAVRLDYILTSPSLAEKGWKGFARHNKSAATVTGTAASEEKQSGTDTQQPTSPESRQLIQWNCSDHEGLSVVLNVPKAIKSDTVDSTSSTQKTDGLGATVD